MRTYEVEITEILQKVIEVKANSKEEAYKIIDEKYNNEEIVLSENDFVCKEIKLVNNKLNYT